MAERAKHAFGALENIDQALANGTIDAFDILFVKDANGKPYIGWIDKEGNKIICQEDDEVVVVEGESLPETGVEGKIYVFGEDVYFWNGTEFKPVAKSADLSALETQVADLETAMESKVDTATVETMIETAVTEATGTEVVEF